MKKYLASGVGIAATLVAVLGSGVAHADDLYKGQTYERAAGDLRNGGWNVVIASRVGDYLPTEQCIVMSGRKSGSLDSSGRRSGSTYLLYLNCNDQTALNGHPGNSVATPEGAKGKQRMDLATRFSREYAKAVDAGKGEQFACFTSGDNTAFCQKLCTETKACSAELSEALGV